MRRSFDRLRQHTGTEEQWQRWQRDVGLAKARYQTRLESRPTPTLAPDLPVASASDEIEAAIRDHQVVIICGETGSGKTTQIPKMCLRLGRGVSGLIGHTQPRRVAARSVATRIAFEMDTEVGRQVGYKIRFTDRTTDAAYIKLMTDGILLAETQRDRMLWQYDTLIIDEAHERSLNVDFLLGYLKQLLPKRPELKVIVTSATIDTERFSKHFNDAPVIEVSGRGYPVEVRYRPLEFDQSEGQEQDQKRAILNAVDELGKGAKGDILVFLSSEREIRDIADALSRHFPQRMEILPLYGRLTAAEQDRVFSSHSGRRIVLATNIAETSLTVPGIRYVIDAGRARISRYSHRSKVQCLPIEPISQASANQRMGRCGRLGPGICVRLYSEEDFGLRPEFTEPEILRTSLAGVILQMKSLQLADIDRFPFVQSPLPKMIRDGMRLLSELGAIDEREGLTPVGHELAHWPLGPRVARMLVGARDHKCLTEMLIITAFLSVQDPRERPAEARPAADQSHAEFRDEQSDFITVLNLWAFIEEQREALSSNQFRKLCRKRFLGFMRIREWRDVHYQLTRQLRDRKGYRLNNTEAGYDAVHQALLTGLVSNIGYQDEDGSYRGARNSRFRVFPGSGLGKRKPKWLVCAELIETSQLYAHHCAKVEPEWIEQAAGSLLRRSYHEPHWQSRRAQVSAYETVLLFGLMLVGKRRVNYCSVDAKVAREVFIQSALVEGRFRSGKFLTHNQSLIDEITHLESQLRRRDLLVDDIEQFRFYDALVPVGICNGPKFEVWRKQAERETPRLLYMQRDYLQTRLVSEQIDHDFPPYIEISGLRYQLDYCFEPGSDNDGVTVTLPAAALRQVDDWVFSWLVPGLLAEKILALLRTLPKPLRRALTPVADTASQYAQQIQPEARALESVLADRVRRDTNVAVKASDFAAELIADHLRFNFNVVDDAGLPTGMGRNFSELRALLGTAVPDRATEASATEFHRDNISAWDFGTLPEVVEMLQGGLRVNTWPAVMDAGPAVCLRLLGSEHTARHRNQAGVARLMLLHESGRVKYLRKKLPGFNAMSLQYFNLPEAPDAFEILSPTSFKLADPRDDLIDEILLCAAVELVEQHGAIRSQTDFEQLCIKQSAALVAMVDQVCGTVSKVLADAHGMRARLQSAQPHQAEQLEPALSRLVYRGFIRSTPWRWLQRLPIYIEATEKRLQTMTANAQRDQQHATRLARFDQDLDSALSRARDEDHFVPELSRFRWMIEELRVSLFAQSLKTIAPVSEKRLQKLWDSID